MSEWVKTYSLVIDPEFQSWIEGENPEKDERLEESLIRLGRAHRPVIVWEETGILVDGHRRYAICKRLGLPYKIESMSFASRDDALLFMDRDEQNPRRNQSSTDRAVQNSKTQKLLAKRLGSAKAAKTLADDKGVSERTIYRDMDYQKALESLPDGVQRQIRSGELKSSKASVIALANLSPVHQLATIANVENGTYPSLGKALKTDSEPESSGSGPAETTDTVSVKNYSDDFDTEKLAGPEPTDAFGNKVPSSLASEFRLAADFEAQRKKLSSIKTWMTQNQNHPGAKILAGAAQRIRTDIDHADSELRFAKPYCVCVYCDDKAGKVQDCKACKGLGWIPQPIFDAAPDKLKRKRKPDAT